MQREQVSRLESLPSELFLSIADYAGFDGRLSLSATNSSCRSLLLQRVFQTLKVTSEEEEASEVLRLAKKIGVNVRAISFHGTAEPNVSKDADETEQDGNNQDPETVDAADIPKAQTQEQILPQAAAELLSGHHLPNATRLIINLAFDFENSDGSEGVWDSRDDLSDGASMYVFTVPETTKAMVEESEAEFPWRRLMAQTWDAASQNANVTSLVVPALVAKAVTPWFDPQWTRFLAQLEDADMRVCGADNGAGWEVGTLEGYMYFVSQLDSYFLAPMTNVKTLKLSCYEHGPLGSRLTQLEENTFALRPECLPKLEELNLEYAVICSELVDFLVAKGDTLRRVALHECFAERSYLEEDGDARLTWASFFSSLRESGLHYQSFTVTNDAPPPLTFKEWQRSKHGDDDEYWGENGKPKDNEVDEDETEDVKNVRAELAREPGKRLFLYATLTDKYGDRWPDEGSIMEYYHTGRDMAEFEKLMLTVGERGDS